MALDLVSVLTGGIGVAGIGLLGAWWESKREHKRWLRDKRLRSYHQTLVEVERLRTHPLGNDDQVRRETLNKMVGAATSLELLGPPSVKRDMDGLVRILKNTWDDPSTDPDGQLFSGARGRFVADVKKVLRIPNE